MVFIENVFTKGGTDIRSPLNYHYYNYYELFVAEISCKKTCERLAVASFGIDFKYHNLRHTYATQCTFNNVNMLLLMKMLGHKKPDTTKRYYLNIEVDKYRDRVLKTLNGLYDFHGRTPEDKPPADFVETIDSKGR